MRTCECGRVIVGIAKVKGKCSHCASQSRYKRRSKPYMIQRSQIKRKSIDKAVRRFKQLTKQVWECNQDKHGACRCYNCGVLVGNKYDDAIGMNFSHLLSKGAFPELYYDPDNVDVLCLPCHRRYENGDKENMRMWPEVEMRIEILKQKSKFFRR